jgi:PAS domain S-box-containing protein
MLSPDDAWFEKWFDAASQWMGILDPDGRVLRANRAALDATGLTQAQVAGVPLWLIPWPALKRQNRQALQQAARLAAGGASSRSELELAHRPPRQPGQIFEFSFHPIPGEAGPPRFILAEGRDITAQRRTREALFQSEARFKTIFEEAGIGIVIKGVKGRMLDCNPAFQAMLGYSAAELRRRDYLEITHPLDKRASRKLFKELVEGKRANYFVEKRYLHKDGPVVWARMTASLVRSQDGTPRFVIGMVENSTAQHQVESELSELRQRLVQGRELERLRIAQDLHDGPLQELIGVSYQVQELAGAVREDASREQLQAIRAALQDLTHSVRTLCGELRPPTLVPFGLEAALRSHIQGFQAAHPELALSSKLAHDGQALPERTRMALFRIYQEALNNVLRHARAKAVKIRFRLSARKAVLEIQDNGVGFELPNRWVRLARQGHLGLVGAMERAREVGGRLEVISAPGQGALLRVSVPVQEEEPAAAGSAEEPKP